MRLDAEDIDGARLFAELDPVEAAAGTETWVVQRQYEHDHQLAACCPTCDRSSVLELDCLIAERRGDYRFVGRKPRCSYCRGRGIWSFRPRSMNQSQSSSKQ